jgi:putative hemolysin
LFLLAESGFILPVQVLLQEDTGGLQIGLPQLPPAFGLVAVLFLVLLNGFFVATEFSLVASRRSRIEQMAAEGSAAARTVKQAIDHLDTYIAATQLGITMASLALGWVGEPAVADLLGPLLRAILPADWAAAGAHAIAVVIAFSAITVLHIVLGEFAPKGLAIQKPESTALFVAIPAAMFLRVFKPFILVINKLGSLVLRLLGLKAGNWEGSVHSVDELRYLVRSSREAGVLEPVEEEIAGRALTLGDLTAHSVMVPRTEMVSVPIDISPEDLMDIAGREHHVRFPVYEDNTDNIRGIIHLTDMFDWNRTHPGEPFEVRAALRPALMVPESIKGDKLLAQMRSARTHTATVVDEFGGVAGLVTLQDLLERIVGEIPESDEESRPNIESLPDGSTRVDGLTPLTELQTLFPVRLEESEAETVGGYVLETLGRVPQVGEELELEPYKLRVTEMDGPRVAELVLSK